MNGFTQRLALTPVGKRQLGTGLLKLYENHDCHSEIRQLRGEINFSSQSKWLRNVPIFSCTGPAFVFIESFF